MRPAKLTPAHRSGRFAELVCSNSLGSGELTSGKGLLKEELRILGSALLPIAEASRVPAGKALAVDREEFGRRVTEAVRSCPGIRVHEEEVKAIPGDPLVILACGPLASDAIASAIRDALGDDGFYFYDAISPIVDAGTIDPEDIVRRRPVRCRDGGLSQPPDGPGTVRGVPLRPADGEDGARCGRSRSRDTSRGACRWRRSRGAVRTPSCSVRCGPSACGTREPGGFLTPSSSFGRKTRRGRCTTWSDSRRA